MEEGIQKIEKSSDALKRGADGCLYLWRGDDKIREIERIS